MGPAILTAVGFFYLAAQRVRDELCSVTDSQYGQTANKLAQVYLEGLGVVDGVGRTAQYHANHRWVVLWKLVVGENLAEGVQFAHPAANELSGLRTEV